MTDASRRVLFFAVASIGGLGLLAALLLLFTRPPRPVAPSSPSVTATPRIVATVDDEPILYAEWQRAVALDWLMSGFVDQIAPSPEETLSRLVNEHLVLREARKSGIPKADAVQGEAWLASFLASWNLDEAALEQALARADLTRSDLVEEVVPRLLQVEQALQELPPDGDGAAWVTELRRRARVVLLENLASPIPVGLVTPPANTPLSPTQPPPQPTPTTLSPAIGPRVGDPAPEFSLMAVDGTALRLSDLHGEPVLLNFLATWCDPCTTELPMLQAAFDDGVTTLAIAVREPQDVVMALVNEAGLEIPVLLDQDGQVSDLYQVHGLPTTLFLDRQGTITARHVGPLDQKTLDDYLSRLLAP
jgi:peroxiredoxin